MMYYLNDDEIKIAGIVEESIVDGPGIRFVVFTQGCPHNCYGCHNPQTHDEKQGKVEKIQNIVQKIRENPILKGITLSGGEPFMQAEKLVKLIYEIQDMNLDVITYTGFKYEDLLNKANKENYFMELIKMSNIIIDGKFEIDKKDENLLFRGSSNQRAIDVKKSLEYGDVVEYNFK